MWVMLGEMFPNQIRGSALAVAGFAQWFANYLIVQSFPIMAAALGLAASYSFYAVSRGDQLLPGPEVHPRDQGQGARGDGGLTLALRMSERRRGRPGGRALPRSEQPMTRTPVRPFRSRDWFAAPGRSDMTALYLERFMNYGITPDELRCGKPIIGIAQIGSDLTPCNRIHLELAERVRDGIRDAGGIPMEFPVHPIFENCRRPTAALDRNLAYLGLVEILHGYPIDAVVLTTGCDKTTPAAIMAASTVDIPAIVLSGGPMLDGWHEGELVGSGTVIWRSRRKLGAGEIDEEEFLAPRHRLGALGRPLQHDGHRLDHERGGRGARHVAARLCGDPGALSRARPDGLRDRPPHRRDGL